MTDSRPSYAPSFRTDGARIVRSNGDIVYELGRHAGTVLYNLIAANGDRFKHRVATERAFADRNAA